MLRYSTPTIYIETDMDLTDSTALWISFKQGDVVLRKTKEELEIKPDVIEVTLNQEETSMFEAYENVKIQLRWLIGSKAGGSNIISVKFYDVLENEVITGEN